ncbi:MAG: DUF2804 domain-containing protein [Oscillospiraceae bacterium]|nr:DUF2804 domain-containing protein [Oscillospiraceae bacterium]
MSTTPYIPSARQHEITAHRRLLVGGDIAEPGYAKQLYWLYDRSDITVPAWRIKEWDCYVVNNQDVGMVIIISDSGMVGNLFVSLIDFHAGTTTTKTAITPFPLGRWNLPSTSETGHVERRFGDLNLGFYHGGSKRVLRGIVQNFGPTKQELRIDLTLTDLPKETTVIATPLGKPGHFYYNQKINCMRVGGSVTLGGEVWQAFDPSDTFATLDWGRGVWTYDNTWLWSSLNTALPDGSSFGWNLGYGFGDTTAASENMLFHNGKAHKLDEVTFHLPQKDGKDDFLAPWKFTSSDGRLEMDFAPVYDNANINDFGVICMSGHQVFGKFTGRAILDDGTAIDLVDRMGFVEKYHNKW